MRPDQMILDRQLADAPYDLLTEVPADWQPLANTAIPMSDWLAHQAAGADLTDVGVILAPDSDVDQLRDHAASLAFAAVRFPRFTDGRGYSHARRLRTLWGYQRPILAFGDVLRDQLVYMHRCGINGFYMADGQDLQASLRSFRLYTEFYQYG